MSDQKNSDQLEKKLRDREQRYRALFERTNDAVFLFSLEDIHMEVNQQAADLLGYSVEEIVGQPISNFTKPGEKRESQKIKKLLLAGQAIPIYERTFVKKDGTEFPAEINIAMVKDSFGNFTHYQSIVRDITERKKADSQREATLEALRKSEEQLRLITENTSDNIAITTFDLKAVYVYVNPSVKSLLGYDPEDMLGKSFFDFIHPDDKKVLFPLLKKYIKFKVKKILTKEALPVSETIEFRFKNKAGSWCFMESTVNIIGDQLLAVTRDISERKRAEEQLAESEVQLRNIFENSTSLFYSHTSDHILTYLSPQVKDILGYTKEEAMVRWTVLASDNPINEIGFQNTVRAIETCKRQPPYELELVRKDGRKIHVEVREFPLVEAGKTTAIIGSLIDITERKKAEEEILKLKEGLEIEVDEKTKELKEKVDHLQRFFDATVDRELRMEELYNENKKLKADLKKQ
ncbi:MAG: PAS domain S-box protein [Candidatus Aminicenantes bacterium]|nr:PAS domain S-box protein [Candidatus Aminicenantes bacterium]